MKFQTSGRRLELVVVTERADGDAGGELRRPVADRVKPRTEVRTLTQGQGPARATTRRERAHYTRSMRLIRTIVLTLAIASAACAPRPQPATPAAPAPPVTIQILAINDLHGHLEPPPGSNGRINAVEAGGAEYLATHLRQAIARQPNSIVVAAGDLVGASPLVSSAFHDEPAIEALDAHGAGDDVGRQPRVRRRLRGAAAAEARRVPPAGRLPGWRRLRRRAIRVPGGQRGAEGGRPPALPRRRRPDRRRGESRLHRRDHARDGADCPGGGDARPGVRG